MKGRIFLYFVAFSMLGLFLPSPSDCSSIERCKKYMPTVIREARYHIGMTAPVHYFMGQIEQESRCNEGATAFDGGMGLGQIMPETAKELHRKYPELRELAFNPYDPKWNIRAMVLYDRACYREVLCQDWYFAFRAYNGGVGNINREINIAKTCNYQDVEKVCKRGKNVGAYGNTPLNLCKVNIEYPYKIFERARKYEPVVVSH
jgi:soluble lytic murein transglycosylase-like protein